MSFLSNKFKLDVKSSESQVAKFISYTDKANLKLSSASANSEYCLISVNAASNYETSIGFATDTVMTLNDRNINIYKDTIIGGNLVIDGYVITTAVDVLFTKDDLFPNDTKGKIDMTSNILVRKQIEIIDRDVAKTSNIIMQSIPSLSKKLFEDGLDVVSSNQETLDFLRNPYNYSKTRFEDRLASKSADDLQNGTQAQFVNSGMLIVQGDIKTSNASFSNINASNVYAEYYYADGSMLINIYLQQMTLDFLHEGSNLFYRQLVVGNIAAASNIHTSNYAFYTFNALDTIVPPHFENTSNYIEGIFVPQIYYLSPLIPPIISDASNYVLIQETPMQTDDTSNYLLHNVLASSNYANYINIVYDIQDDIVAGIYQNITDTIIDTSNYVKYTSNILANQLLQMLNSNSADSSINTRINTVETYSNALMHILNVKTQDLLYDIRSVRSNQFIIDISQRVQYTCNIISQTYDRYATFNSNISTVLSNDIRNIEKGAIDYLNSTLPSLYRANQTTSNYLQSSSNNFVNAMNNSIKNVLAYRTQTSNQLENVLKRRVNSNVAYANAKYNEADGKIKNKVSQLNTSKIRDGTSNLYYTEAKFDEFFSQLTMNHFSDGATNKVIVNDTYKGNLSILGTLYASNIFISEYVSSIETNIYKTGNCSLGYLEILYDYNNTADLLVLGENVVAVKNDKVGVFKSPSVYDFEVAGMTNADYFIGKGDFAYINLDDKTTAHLSEGSNLYFTKERVSLLINTSNINVSNYVRRTSDWIDGTNKIRFNYISNESNMIQAYYDDPCEYASNTYNGIAIAVDYFDMSFSNYVLLTSNQCIQYTNRVNVDIDMTYYEASSSNYIANIYPNISNVIVYVGKNMSNYLKSVDEFLITNIDSKLPVIIRNQSNYVASTSNTFFNLMTPVARDLLNYINQTSNSIAREINKTNNSLDVYVNNTITNLTNYTTSTLAMLDATTNIYTVTDIYAAEAPTTLTDAKQLTTWMAKEGFVIHFTFRTENTYDTPLYVIGSSSISVVNIRVLYGNLYVKLGFNGNGVSMFSPTIIKKNTWYTVDIVAYIGSEISLKMYINQVQQNANSAIYNGALNYANLMITSVPVMLPVKVGEEYYIAYTEGTYNVSFAKNVLCTIFMIGGGGGGGYNYGGGGGAGAYYYATNYMMEKGVYNIKVGKGGAGGTESSSAENGEDTYIGNVINLRCKGGGRGGSLANDGSGGPGGPGGCGGGGLGWDNSIIGSRLYAGGAADNLGTVGIGFSGGSGYSAFANKILSGGGGGGIGGVGQSANATQKEGGNGGHGLIFNIKGINEVYGGGGGGGEWATYTTNPAGLGGGAMVGDTYIRVGGDAMRNTDGIGGDGKPHTGSGGGSGRNYRGGSGGSGIIIIRFSEDTDVSAYLGTSQGLQQTYSQSVAYTNTYFSNDAIKYSASNREDFSNLIAISSNYFYKYSSNMNTINANYYDNADTMLQNVYDLKFVLTELNVNIRLPSGYYNFVLDLQNEVSADLLLDDFLVTAYYNPQRLNNPMADIMNTSNQITVYPIYIPEGYYKLYLRMLRTISNRHNRYFIPKYHYTADWQGAYYTLNDVHGVLYQPFASNIYNATLSNLQMNTASSTVSNTIDINEFKIFNNPITMGADYSINNILGAGKDSGIDTSVGKVRPNRWQEKENTNDYIYYDEGNVRIGSVSGVSGVASLEVFTKFSLNSLKTNNPIWTNLGVIMSSDERIKKDMTDITDASALEAILKIEPKKYSYIDTSGSNVYGFIAQQVKEVLPEAVSMNEGFVPNVYQRGVVEGNQLKQITLDESIKSGDKLLIFDDRNNRYVEEVIIDNSHTFIHLDDGNVFVYGTYVEDFHTLDKSYIYTVNVCALQELHKRYLEMHELIHRMQNYDDNEMPKLAAVLENMEQIKCDDIELLRKNADDLLYNFNNCKYLVEMGVADDLEKLTAENKALLEQRESVLAEYERLSDILQNQMNEMLTIKTIMQMKQI